MKSLLPYYIVEKLKAMSPPEALKVIEERRAKKERQDDSWRKSLVKYEARKARKDNELKIELESVRLREEAKVRALAVKSELRKIRAADRIYKSNLKLEIAKRKLESKLAVNKLRKEDSKRKLESKLAALARQKENDCASLEYKQRYEEKKAKLGQCVKCGLEVEKNEESIQLLHCSKCLKKSWIRNYDRKISIMSHYCGGKPQCQCPGCDVVHISFLQIDHKYGGGNRHRTRSGKRRLSGQALYAWIVNNSFPDGFQVLCANCNYSKGTEIVCEMAGGTHQKESI